MKYDLRSSSWRLPVKNGSRMGVANNTRSNLRDLASALSMAGYGMSKFEGLSQIFI
jgi:hypothetical protein